MDEEDKMPNTLGRRRLKDCIIEGVSRAIKKIHRCHCGNEASDSRLVLTNRDTQFHKLVEHLDHAFLHGLRNITNGYWVVVQDFTHKSTVTKIQQMTNVTTNLGRGRAWLYLALSDQILECYLQCFIEDAKRIRRFYLKEALVLDQPQLHVLLSLSAGLEHVLFEVDVDVPYLDLASHMREREPRADVDDRISVCSLDSSVSQDSSSTADWCNAVAGSYDSEDSWRARDAADTSSLAASVSSLGDDSRIERIFRLNAAGHDNGGSSRDSDASPSGSGVEVIHVKRTKCRRRSRKQHRVAGASAGAEAGAEVVGGDVCSPLQSPESGYRSVMERSAEEVPVRHNGLPARADSRERLDPQFEASDDWTETEGDGCRAGSRPGTPGEREKPDERFDELGLPGGTADAGPDRDDCGAPSCSPVAGGEACSETAAQRRSREGHCADTVHSAAAERRPERSPRDGRVDAESDGKDLAERGGAVDSSSAGADKTDGDPASADAIILSIYDNFQGSDESPETPSPCEGSAKGQGGDCVAGQRGAGPDGAHSARKQNPAPIHRNEYRVDHNLMLLLMLHVFKDEDEHFVRMFRTSMGHTEGDVRLIYVLITSRAVYILTRSRKRPIPFHKEAVVTYAELDYLSLSLNYQVINIVCVNRRKQFWISTGDEQLSRCIVSFVDAAVRAGPHLTSRLSVLTDATTQKIALHKWIGSECNKPPNEVSILCYVLVHWEHVAGSRPGSSDCAGRREGSLQFCWHKADFDDDLAEIWQPAYFVLRGGVLYQYDHVARSTLRRATQLSSEDCFGCRRLPLAGRPHCFQLLLAGGSTLQLAADSDVAVQQWLQSLCEVVAAQTVVSPAARLACCCVLAAEHVFVCHEDTQTSFVRTLAVAPVTDVVGVTVDAASPTYCVLALNTQNAAGAGIGSRWILYFNAVPERDLFLHRLRKMWKAQFQVALSVDEISDLTLRRQSLDGVVTIETVELPR